LSLPIRSISCGRVRLASHKPRDAARTIRCLFTERGEIVYVASQSAGAFLEFKGELKRWPKLSMVCDKECLILLH